MATAVTEIGGLTWTYRPETNDLGIIDQVFTNNACHMPEDMKDWFVLDIGAHIGAASAIAASRGAIVRAYEPSSSSFQVLLANILANNLSVNPFHSGVGSLGIKKLYLDKYNTGQNSEFLIFPELSEEIFEYMYTVRLAETLANMDCDFLKLDCEGCEETVIEDILGGLYKRIRRIFIEFHSNIEQSSIVKLSRFYSVKFLGYGYMLER